MTNQIRIRNRKGQSVGTFDLKNKIYYTIRDADKGQVFLKPNRRGDLAIDRSIAIELNRLHCRIIQMTILNFEDKPITVKIDFNKFLEKSKTICFDKKKPGAFYSQQKMINIKEFERVEVCLKV